MKKRWKSLIEDAVSLVWQTPCPLCQRSTAGILCNTCQKQVQRCHLPSPWQTEPKPSVFIWGNYSGKLKQALTALKYENRPLLAQPLGEWLAKAWLPTQSTIKLKPVVVPIPMHVHKKQERGYDQAALLAQSFAHFTQLPLKLQGLERSRETTAQFKLSIAEREHNLSNAFSLGTDFHTRKPTLVLLLDDIYTTGATVRSATQTLHRHGIRVCSILTIASSKYAQ